MKLKREWNLEVELRSSSLLAQYMAWRRLTVRKLAALVGVSKSTIGHLRSGKRSYCDPLVANRIADVLDVPVDVLFFNQTG